MAKLTAITNKAKKASPTAQGSSMGKSVPKVGSSAPSKSNEQQPVTKNQNFTNKSLAFKKVSSGY